MVRAPARARRSRPDLRARRPPPQGRPRLGGERGAGLPCCNRRRGHPAPSAYLADCAARGLAPDRAAIERALRRLAASDRGSAAVSGAARGRTGARAAPARTRADGPNVNAGGNAAARRCRRDLPSRRVGRAAPDSRRPRPRDPAEPRGLDLAPDRPRPRAPSDRRPIAYHAARACGGVGAVFLEATAVDPSGLLTPHTLAGFQAAIVAGYRRLASAVHGQGTRLFVQLFHGGREQISAAPRAPAVAPSAVPSPRFRTEPRALTTAELRELAPATRRRRAPARAGWTGWR